MASSSNPSNQKSFKYQVFLSFRGEDTRKTFVDHLYASLKQLGIHTFRDNEELEKGKQIDQLFKAIEESRFFIIVFSKDYASSSWCLKELAKIMECQDGKEQIAYPLFYDVEPSHIRKRSGPVGEAIAEAIAKDKTNEQIWKKALEDAGNLVGWDLKNIANGHEAEAIKTIVEQISLKLRSIHLRNDENVIGMECRMKELESSLGIGLDDKARMIGIKGMGGIGKTTLARSIFDKFSSHFEGSCFVEDIRELSKKKDGREISKKEGLRSLQERVISALLKDNHVPVESVYEGERIMRMRLPYKKVLLVLDNVDDIEQLEVLAGDWFKDGSRIIVTTRDEKVLLSHGVNVNWIHDVSLLSDEEAMSLFSRYAFKRYIPDQGYEELSSEVVSYAAGLPLTIKVLGSHLRGENELTWRNALKRLETIPSRETLEVLEISYNSLEDDHKEMFLDVACFLKGAPEYLASNILESCGFSAAYGLRILEQKSLITISNDDILGMHDRIEELGKNIVRRVHPHEPNKHSRLWIEEEIEELFFDDGGTKASTCIGLQLLLKEQLSPEIIIKNLGNLNKLRFLFLYGNPDDCFPSDWKFDQAKKYFPNSLKCLDWKGYPGLSLPQTFRANNLVGLELPNSRIVQLWESGEEKVLKKLRFLNLRDSKLRTLDLGMTPNIERLDLKGCHDLTEIRAPAGCLERLVFVVLYGCPWSVSFSLCKKLESLVLRSIPDLLVSVECLEEFPKDSTNNLPLLSFDFDYSKEKNLLIGIESKGVRLDLQPRTKLESVLGTICGLQHLRHLTFYGRIPELPDDLHQLKCLEELDLWSTHIKCLPDSVCMLKFLKSLRLDDCEHLQELPENLGCLENLEELILSSTSIRRLPDSICMLIHLKLLQLDSCRHLEKLPEDIGQLECLEKLDLTKCASLGDIPNSICNMKCLRYLYLPFCSQVQKLPEDFGNLKLLEELDIPLTGISHLPHSISSLKGLRIYGSTSLLQSCAFATEILETTETGTFCYIQVMNSTLTPTELRSQSTENYLKRDGKEILIEDGNEGAPGGGIRIEEITDEVAAQISEKDEASSSGIPNMTPDMLTDMMSKMPAEELQIFFYEMASSFKTQNPMATNRSNIPQGQQSQRSSSDGQSGQGFVNTQPSFPISSSDIRSQLNNPAMCEVLKKLRLLNLKDSKLRTLDLGMTPNLENLDLKGCHDLTEIHVTAGCLERLVRVDLRGCPWSVSFSFVKQLESHVLLSLPELYVIVECLDELPRDPTNNLPMLRFAFYYSKEQPSSAGLDDSKIVCLDLEPCTKLETVSGSICGLQSLRHLTFFGCIPEAPNDLDQLKCLQQLTLRDTHIKCLPDSLCMLKHLTCLKLSNCQHLKELPQNLGWLESLEELGLWSTSIRRLPDSICMLKHLKYLHLDSCGLLEKLPEDIGQLECLEKLDLDKCESLVDIPNSICNMKCLRYFYLSFCSKVQKLPEELGNLKLLKELDIANTGIGHLPPNISSLKGLQIFGSVSLLQSCAAFATEIITSEELGTYCYIQAVNSTPSPTELRSQSIEKYLKRDGKDILIEDGDEGTRGGGIRIEEITDEVATPISEKDEASSSELSNDVNKLSREDAERAQQAMSFLDFVLLKMCWCCYR